jgi:acyl phosphate:glycerol-3-phosphate acyltransferase
MEFLLLVVGYVFGSINSAIVICKLMGLPSPRSVGSGNPGATNVLRLGNKKAAALTLFFDVLKGWIPVFIALLAHVHTDWLCWVALATILGHAYPLFFGFKGGKGVATGLGVLLGVNPLLGLFVLITWIVVALIFRYSSLAAIVSVVLTPLYGFFLLHDRSAISVLVLMALFILIRHKDNIARLLAGKESKIGRSS